ncbi:hypothetical protein [Haloferula rosea]|uniref:Uncharacterized protein n=1 Tax=Haloferula rosea TaxID=490093 RepID=A0A934VGG5_9BACT|nr:hypothetical protein [Haloferula rosea]MBK1828046.1 hypothetical protein [Haloferula rosea]
MKQGILSLIAEKPMTTDAMNYLKRGLCAIGVLFVGSSMVAAKDEGAALPLSGKGESLAAEYGARMDELRSELADRLPDISDSKREAFFAAIDQEVAAKAALEDARKRVGEIQTAKALVAHAKGKWIGGADKGIAAAKAAMASATTDEEKKAAEADLAKWEQNRLDGLQALEERQAALVAAEKNRAEVELALKSAEAALVVAEDGPMRKLSEFGLDQALSSNALDGALARYVVMKEATPRGLAAFAEKGEEQEALVEKLLSADDLLVQMLVADGAREGRYGRALEIYRDIWQASEMAGEGALQRLALAISLEHAVPVGQRNAVAATDAPAVVDPVKRYLHFEKALLDGELDPAFVDLTVWDYRMVVNGEEPDEILQWGREMLRNYRPDHITTPDYRWRYVAAVRSDIRYGSQDNQYDKDELQFFQNILMNGGICGRRAFFGRFILRAFGIPTTARPQRGHAALAHWTPDGWVVCLGGGWGAGWTKTRYNKDLDFLANTQARAAGDVFMKVKRAQWMGDVVGEPRVFGLLSGKPEFWNAVALYAQRGIVADSKAEALAAVGEDIGEANETKEKVEIVNAELSGEDRKITLDEDGRITIPAVATTRPTKSNGKIILMKDTGGNALLHYSRTGGHQDFEYEFDAPEAGRYELRMEVVTPSWKQALQLEVNESGSPQVIALPFTVGMWQTSDPVVVELKSGANRLRFFREGEVKGVTLRKFTLSPVSSGSD